MVSTDTGAVRSWLFVPADRPERFAKAAASGADAVILDLEDAVAPERRAFAVNSVRAWLDSAEARSARPQIWVRVPDVQAQAYLQAQVGGSARLNGWVVPKVERAQDLRGWGRPVMAQIETPHAIEYLPAILAGRNEDLAALALGPEDLSVALDTAPGAQALAYAAARLVMAARAHDLHVYACPGSLAEFRDLAAWRSTLASGRALGSDGALCIHPAQLEAVHAVFSPDPEDVAWAHRVMAAWRTGAGAVALDGRMIDRPVVLRAMRTLAKADRAGASADREAVHG